MGLGEEVSAIVNGWRKDQSLMEYHYTEANSEFIRANALEQAGNADWLSHYMEAVEHLNAARAYERILGDSAPSVKEFFNAHGGASVIAREYRNAEERKASIVRQVFESMPTQKYVQ